MQIVQSHKQFNLTDMDSKHQSGFPNESTNSSLHRTETPPPQYADVAPPPPRAFTSKDENAPSYSHLEVPSSTGCESQRTSMEYIVNDAENRRSSFDPQEPSTWTGSKWAEIKQQWKERQHGPREPKDARTGRGPRQCRRRSRCCF